MRGHMNWLHLAREINGTWGEGFAPRTVSVRGEAAWRDTAMEILAAAGHRPSPDGAYSLLAAEAVDLPAESYRLRFVPSGGGGTIALAASDACGLRYGCQTAAELMGAVPAGDVSLVDGPSFRRRGLVEGFYGPPWRDSDRLALLSFMADCRLNTYIYAPKDDPLHRGLWRKPYGPEALRRFAVLSAAAAKQGVDFGVAVSPGLTLRYGAEDDYRKLLAKFEQFLRLGIRVFGLYLDDIPGVLAHQADRDRFGTLARAQVELANRLLSDLRRDAPGTTLLFCPTEYHGRGDSPYLDELGAGLDPAIEVHWTGRGVWSPRITADEARRVGAVLRRPPLIWDNSFANDYLMTPELHLAPFLGRAGDLSLAARGILANPMTQPTASRFALATMALYLWRPERYLPERAGEVAAGALFPDEARMAFAHFSRANAMRVLPPLGPLVPRAALWQSRRRASREEFDAARRIWAAEVHLMQTNAGKLRIHLPEQWRKEIAPWLSEYEAWARLAAHGLGVEEGLAKLASTEKAWARIRAYLRLEGELARLRRELKRSVGWRTNVCGGAVREHLIELCQRVDGLIEAMTPVPPVLRSAIRLVGLVSPPRDAYGLRLP